MSDGARCKHRANDRAKPLGPSLVSHLGSNGATLVPIMVCCCLAPSLESLGMVWGYLEWLCWCMSGRSIGQTYMKHNEIWNLLRDILNRRIFGISLRIYKPEWFMEFVERYTKPSDSWNWLKDIQDRMISGICLKIYKPELLSNDLYDVKQWCSNILWRESFWNIRRDNNLYNISDLCDVKRVKW